MQPEDQLILQRKQKLEELRNKKINPYPYSFDKKNNSKEILEKFKDLKNGEKTKTNVSIAGRIMTLRLMGRASFAHLQDEAGRIQFYIREDDIGKEQYEVFKRLYDLGDIVGVEGVVFRTEKGEISVWTEKITLLSKGLRPLPEKFHGLKDPEIRHRQRYLDLVMNHGVKEAFIKRTKFLNYMREYLNERGFIEVEIPTLQSIYGGANARPFTTHLNALDVDLFLSISPELYLKRLVVGGFEKVYTISKNFRNEGIDKFHNPEFTSMELYQAYVDYNEIMKLTEELIEHIAKKIYGTTKLPYQDQIIDFKTPWPRMTMFESLKKFAKIDAEKISDKELASKCKELKIDVHLDHRDEMVGKLFEELVQQKLIQPIFIIDHPLGTSPLTKIHRKNPKLVERFEVFVYGMEIANAYSELNDPIDQRERLKKQEQEREFNDEAMAMDEDFVKALEYGMPPTGGLGIGIDRMVMFFTNASTIREVILFPMMRPEQEL